MRIKLAKGKQKEMISLAKKDLTWRKLARILNCSEGYLRNELKNERTTLKKEKYNSLCKLIKINFDKHIIAKLKDNWGRSKGGINSSGNIKKIKNPQINEDLAEAIGIILGDGHVSKFKKGKKVRCYFIKIAGNSKTDKDYLMKYIPNLLKKVFNDKGKIFLSKNSNVGYCTIYGLKYISFLNSLGIKSGNKKENNQPIPNWIKKDKKLLSKCIRGLIDTDGSIHFISKNNLNLRISYTSHIPKLLSDVRDSLIKLGFNPSKIIKERQIFLSRQEEIEKYVREIGFGNNKNLNRLKILKNMRSCRIEAKPYFGVKSM